MRIWAGCELLAKTPSTAISRRGREGGRKEEREGGLRNIYRDCARHYASFSLTLVVSVKLILTTTHELSFCLYFYR